MRMSRDRQVAQKGIAAVELALILPLLLVMVFGIIDFGRLVQARLIVTNVSREGGSLVSRKDKSVPVAEIDEVINMLQASGTPLDLNGLGRIYVWRIAAGTSQSSPNPSIDTRLQRSRGSLAVSSSIGSSLPRLGLSDALYQHLRFEGSPQNTSDIAEVWVVESFYKYKPITPLPRFISNLLITPGYDGRIISSKSVF